MCYGLSMLRTAGLSAEQVNTKSNGTKAEYTSLPHDCAEGGGVMGK